MDLSELESLLCGYWLSDLANFSAYLYENLSDINWVGFYLSNGKSLKLGPFMGKVACLEIAFGKGVCGSAYVQQKSLLVDDVDAFASHIRCDARSKSEVVVPFFIDGKIVGVLDVDSPTIARFTLEDQAWLENAVQILSKKIETMGQARFGILE